jgi:UDP-glucuronate 4-epimerase
MISCSENILITGGAGFIGSHLAEALLRAGACVAVMDSFDSFYPPACKRRNLQEVMQSGQVMLFECDIRDVDGVDRAFSQFRPTTVIHLAARAGVRPSIEEPLLYEQVNVGGTYILLEAARRRRIRNFVLASSSSVYGEGAPAPFREDNHFLRPISPYAASKLATESIAYTYAHLFGMNIACLRFFTVYGPRQRPDLAIHKFTRLLESGCEIPMFGDGTAGRDYTYIDDIVNGICAAAQWCSGHPGGVCEIFNLGNSSPVTLNALLSALENATGKSAIRKRLAPQPGDVSLTWADIDKASSTLGYQPRTRLSDGLSRFVHWYRTQARKPLLTTAGR